MTKKVILLAVVLVLSFSGFNTNHATASTSVLVYNASIYYSNQTSGNLYISLYNVSTSSNVGSWQVPPGSGFLVSVPEGTYHSYMGGNGGTYTFNINGATATGTGHSFHNVYLSAGSNSFSAY